MSLIYNVKFLLWHLEVDGTVYYSEDLNQLFTQVALVFESLICWRFVMHFYSLRRYPWKMYWGRLLDRGNEQLSNAQATSIAGRFSFWFVVDSKYPRQIKSLKSS